MSAESLKEKNKLTEPPIKWFFGAGFKDTGVYTLIFSDALTQENNGEVGRQIEAWYHCRVTKDSNAASAEKVRRAEAYIELNIGFTMQELDAARQKALEKYKGQTTVPFEVILR